MVFTIAVVVFALTFVVAGRIQDKFGPLYCSLAGGVLVSLGFFLCAYTTSLTYLFICFGVIGGLGNGFGYATPIPVMAKWFPDKRGLAVGLAVGGYGAGSAIFGPLAQLKLIPMRRPQVGLQPGPPGVPHFAAPRPSPPEPSSAPEFRRSFLPLP